MSNIPWFLFFISQQKSSRNGNQKRKTPGKPLTHFHPPHPVLFPLPTVVRCGTNCHTVPRRPILLRPTSVPSLVSMICRPNFWFVALTSTCLLRKRRLLSTLRASCSIVFLNFRIRLPPRNRRTGPPSHRFDPFPQLFLDLPYFPPVSFSFL